MKPALIRRTIVGLIAFVVIVALAFFFARIPRTVSVFLIAAFIAFGATPLVRGLEKRMARPVAIGIVYLGLLGALVIAALVIVPVTYAQVASLLDHAPEYVSASQDLVARADRGLQARLGSRVLLPSVAVVQAQVGSRVADVLSRALYSVGDIVVGTANALFIGVSALILSVFFVARGPQFSVSLLEFVPPRKREQTKALFDEIASVFGHFVAGQAFLCTIVGVVVYLTLLPLNFHFALLVAVICGLGYAVPFVGLIVAHLLAAVLAVPQGGAMVASVTVDIFIVARIADSVLVPKVMSESVGVSPVGVMFAVFAGGELFGIAGLLLGIPAAALIKVLFKFFVQPYVLRMQVEGGPHRELLVEVVSPSAEPATVSTEIPPDDTGPIVVSIRT